MGNRNCHRTPREKLAIIEYAEKNTVTDVECHNITAAGMCQYDQL